MQESVYQITGIISPSVSILETSCSVLSQFFSLTIRLLSKNLLFVSAHKYRKWRWKTLLLSALHVRRRHRKYQESVQRLSRHHSADALTPIRALVTSFPPSCPPTCPCPFCCYCYYRASNVELS